MSKKLTNIINLFLIMIILIIVLFPFFWMISCSFRPFSEIYTSSPSLFPKRIMFDNYRTLFNETNFLTYFTNSMIIASGTALFSMVISSLGAYSITRFSYPGRNIISFFILFSYTIPIILLFVPIFLTLAKMHLLNTYIGIILANTSYCLPFEIWLLVSFFKEIPFEIEEAGLVDGASRLRVFFVIVLPMAVPGIISVSIFAFILAWNQYLLALVILISDKMKTLPVAIAEFSDATSVQWGLIMSAGTMTALPIFIFFFFIRKYLIQVLGTSGLKG